MMHRASVMRVLVRRRWRISLLLARGISRGLLFIRISGTRPRLLGVRPSRGILPDGVDDMLSLPPAWTHETRLPIEVGIPELWDTLVPIISGTCTDIVCLSLPQHGLRELVLVLRCGIGTGYFANRLERPGHGSRSGTGLTCRDFGDLGACLRHYTLN